MIKQSFNQRCNLAALIAGQMPALKDISVRALDKLSVLSMELEHAQIKQYQELAKVSALMAQMNSELMGLWYLQKIEQNKIVLNSVEYSICEFLETQAAFTKLIAKSSKVTTIDVVCDKLLVWEFDQLLLAVAIRSAALNALKLANSKILFAATVEDEFLRIGIEDDGAGMPLEVLRNSSSSNSCSSGGNGCDSRGNSCMYSDTIDVSNSVTNSHFSVGLHFAKTIAAMHSIANKQGYVALSDASSIGGSEFMIYLP